VALLWKMICNLGDPMSLRHPGSLAILALAFSLVLALVLALALQVSLSITLALALEFPLMRPSSHPLCVQMEIGMLRPTRF